MVISKFREFCQDPHAFVWFCWVRLVCRVRGHNDSELLARVFDRPVCLRCGNTEREQGSR